jgi:hypothetical protein
MDQLESDLRAFFEQARATLLAKDYLERRAAAEARFSGLHVPRLDEDSTPLTADIWNVIPPTPEERRSRTFLEYVRSREADFFSRAPDFHRTPTFDERPRFVAARRYYEERLRAYSQAWTCAPTRVDVPDPQLALPIGRSIPSRAPEES